VRIQRSASASSVPYPVPSLPFVGGWIGFHFDLPPGLHLLLALVGAIVAAGLWGGIAGFLKARTGATTYAFHLSADPAFSPDILLRDGDTVAGMTAIHTPGHASDHLCFARPGGLVFSADHVMSWSSSIVSPPGSAPRVMSMIPPIGAPTNIPLPSAWRMLRTLRRSLQMWLRRTRSS